MYQHFEGGYVEYDRLPAISNGVLSFSGTVKSGVRFSQEQDLSAQMNYDPPPHSLSRGQVARTYCYDNGLRVAGLRAPLAGSSNYTTDEFTATYDPCPDPYDVAADTPGPRSPDEAHQAWQDAQDAYDVSRSVQPQTVTVPWATAREWTAAGTYFAVKADISEILNRHGDGVYSILVWGDNRSAGLVISEYSMFHGVEPPDTYHPNRE
jgi:hypothetical protein